MELSDVRRALVDARAHLRSAQDNLHHYRLKAELRLVEQVNGDTKALGSNEADRKRAFDAACDQDSDVQTFLSDVRTFQQEVERLEAEIECALDRRAERDLAVRERNVVSTEAWLTTQAA